MARVGEMSMVCEEKREMEIVGEDVVDYSHEEGPEFDEDLPDHLKSILEYYKRQVPGDLTDLSPGNDVADSTGRLEFSNSMKKSVVCVSTFIGVNRMLDCSGIVIHESGFILTTAKLLRLPKRSLRRYYHFVVRFSNGAVFEAKEHYVDFFLNFAILKVLPTHRLPFIKLIDRREQFGNHQLRIALLGRKFFQLSLKQVDGVLLSHPPAFGCDYLLSTTCRAYQACEGGPIINGSGEVIGISFVDDAGFAHLLPSYYILSAYETWKHTGCVIYPSFGLTLIQVGNVLPDTMEVLGISPDNKGQLLVKHVYPGGPADELKIRPGDRLISFDGCKVFEPIEYFKLLIDISRGMSTCQSDSVSTDTICYETLAPTNSFVLEIQRQANEQTVLVEAEILPSTDRKLCIYWPFQEDIWLGNPLEGSQKAPLRNSYSLKLSSLRKSGTSKSQASRR